MRMWIVPGVTVIVFGPLPYPGQRPTAPEKDELPI